MVTIFSRIGITGSPGTGKKTLAKGLSLATGYKVININQLCISKGAILGRDKYGIIADTRKLKKILAENTMHQNFILVGHLLPYVSSPDEIDFTIVLRCNPYTLGERLRQRRYPEGKTLMNLGAEILGTSYFDTIKKFGKRKVHVIDTSSRSPNETLDEALLALSGRIRYDGSDIDWLGLVRDKGDLRRFFPDSYR
ncbi:MAG: adenylate kinase family protein [Nitrososphaeria archaeon]